MVKTKPTHLAEGESPWRPVSSRVFRSVAAGMIAWLRTRGVHLAPASRPWRPPFLFSKPIFKPGRIQITPGSRSFGVMFGALLLLGQIPAQADTHIRMLGKLNHSLNGQGFTNQQKFPIFHETFRRKDLDSVNPAAVGMVGGAVGTGIVSAIAEPCLLTSKRDMLMEDPSERELLSWQRSNPKGNAKGLGFMLGGLSAGIGSYVFLQAGGDLKAAALGVGAGTLSMATIGSSIRGSWGAAARWGIFGAASSLLGIGLTQTIGSSLSK